MSLVSTDERSSVPSAFTPPPALTTGWVAISEKSWARAVRTSLASASGDSPGASRDSRRLMASRNSSAVWNRCAGSLRSTRSTMASSSPSTPGRTLEGGMTRCSAICSINSPTVLPSNSLRPVSISKTSRPTEKMSLRRSTGWPRACSGLM